MSKKKAFKLPHTFIILTVFILFMSFLSYIIPAGMYERFIADDGRAVVDPSTFHYIKNTPVSVMQFLTSIPQGFVEAGFIIALSEQV